jgi:hypothetical protein
MKALYTLIKQRSLYEALLVLVVTVVFSIGIAFLGGVAPKFQVALAVGLVGLIVFALVPEKRTFALFVWVLVQPLSIEKILYTDTPVWSTLHGLEIVMNAGDVLLILLTTILVFERLSSKKSNFVWDTKTFLFFGMIIWAVISYAIHLLYLKDTFVNTVPLGLLHLTRVFLFVLIFQSAIKTRADVIWILVAVLISLFMQSLLVMLSFATKESYSFMRLIGGPMLSQSYSAGANTIFRASGTLGVANQQGLYHAMFTFLLVSFFAVKNKLFRIGALIVILLSLFAVLFTFSRGAWLCLILSSILITSIFYKRNEISPQSWLIGALGVMLFTIALSAVIQPIIDRLSGGDNGATGSRVRMMYLAKDLFLHNPIIGVGQAEYVEAGLQLYPPGYSETEWVPLGEESMVPPLGRVELATTILPDGEPFIVPLSVHNKFLLVLSELGSVGLALWLWIWYCFYSDAKKLSALKEPLFRYLGVAGLGVVLVSVVYMNVDLFSEDKTMQVLLFPLVLISAASRIGQQRARNT